MSHIEEKLLGRWSGRQTVIASLVFGFAGILPLLLYIMFGPSDGNPLGLGLLAAAAIPLAGIGILVGFIKLIIEYFRRRGE